jgi:hypothetical protein
MRKIHKKIQTKSFLVEFLLRRSSKHTSLTVAAQVEGVVALPDGTTAATLGLVVQMALADTAVSTAGGGQPTELAVLVDSLGDPVDAGITADGLVGGVHKDDLVELVGGVLGNPVRVEHTETPELAAGALLESD